MHSLHEYSLFVALCWNDWTFTASRLWRKIYRHWRISVEQSWQNLIRESDGFRIYFATLYIHPDVTILPLLLFLRLLRSIELRSISCTLRWAKKISFHFNRGTTWWWRSKRFHRRSSQSFCSTINPTDQKAILCCTVEDLVTVILLSWIIHLMMHCDVVKSMSGGKFPQGKRTKGDSTFGRELSRKEMLLRRDINFLPPTNSLEKRSVPKTQESLSHYVTDERHSRN